MSSSPGSPALATRDSASPAGCQAAEPHYRLFTLIVVLLPLAFLAASIPIARSRAFPAISGDPYLLNPDYAFNLRRANCDVVIFGDSTALTGIDPVLVSRRTGLKTCNIAQSQGVLEVTGFLALDSYLRRNAAPKFIVMQFAPETLARSPKVRFSWQEGMTLLLRRRSLATALPLMITHPVGSYIFASWAVRAAAMALLHRQPDFRRTELLYRQHGGLLVLPKPAETRCMREAFDDPPNASWVMALRSRYSRNGTRVVVDIAPLPDCTPGGARQIAAGTRRVTDNSLLLLPIGLFCDLDRHLTLQGADLWSLYVARQLDRQRWTIPSSAPTRVQPPL